MKTSLLNGAQWAAVLRIGLGLWWLESFRHKNLEAWIKRQAGINWAADIAGKHKFAIVGRGFNAVVKPHPKAMTWVVLLSELSLGLGLTLGFLTPVAAFASIALNLLYFVLMIHDWAEQGQNAMMILAAVVILGLQGGQIWSIDHLIHIFEADPRRLKADPRRPRVGTPGEPTPTTGDRARLRWPTGARRRTLV